MLSSNFRTVGRHLKTTLTNSISVHNYKLQNFAFSTADSPKILKSDKIIFLDVDGVLNDYTNIGKDLNEIPGGADVLRDMYTFALFNKNVDPFIKVVKESNAKIVLSSTWREHEQGVKFLKQCIFDKHNLDFIGRTPNNTRECQVGHGRFNEILKWFSLEFENDISHEEILKISWVAIDDDPYSHMENFIEDNPHLTLENRLIKCNSNIGFTNEHIDLTLKHLGV